MSYTVIVKVDDQVEDTFSASGVATTEDGELWITDSEGAIFETYPPGSWSGFTVEVVA